MSVNERELKCIATKMDYKRDVIVHITSGQTLTATHTPSNSALFEIIRKNSTCLTGSPQPLELLSG
jgi:hypothetical protein